MKVFTNPVILSRLFDYLPIKTFVTFTKSSQELYFASSKTFRELSVLRRCFSRDNEFLLEKIISFCSERWFWFFFPFYKEIPTCYYNAIMENERLLRVRDKIPEDHVIRYYVKKNKIDMLKIYCSSKKTLVRASDCITSRPMLSYVLQTCKEDCREVARRVSEGPCFDPDFLDYIKDLITPVQLKKALYAYQIRSKQRKKREMLGY